MTTLIRYIFIAIGLFLGTTPLVFAQEASGTKLYQRMGYKTSIPKLEEQAQKDVDVMAKIANSYRLNHDTQNAELWYAQVVESSNDPNHFLYYAQALQSNGKTERAKQYYLIYDEMMGGAASDRRGELLAAAIDRMNEFEHSDVQIENVAVLNSGKLDFSPAYYNDGVVFVSTRTQNANDSDQKDIWIDDHFMNLFFAEQNTQGGLNVPTPFSGELTTKFHEGPVSFTRNGDQIFFTRNHYNNGKRKNNSKGVMKLQIYTANKSGDDWNNVRELPFNTVEFEEAHPAISPDGSKLFFASDRDGGQGGMDLYVSEFQQGTWSEPTNLGPSVNTAGNELFPFVHDDGTLYFASDGWGGLGGLDIFFTQLAGDGGQWQLAQNIGTPFNSPKDDFGYVMNILGTEGYFTSARNGGHGKDDIYKFVKNSSPATFKTLVCTYKDGTDARIEGVTVEIQEKISAPCDTPPTDIDLELVEADSDHAYLIKLKQRAICNAQNESVFVTDKNGEVSIPLFPDKEYVAIATKDGYEVGKHTFSTYGKTLGIDKLDFCIPLTKLHCAALTGVVNNKKYDRPLPYATVTLINMCSGEKLSFQTNTDGTFDLPCIECGCDFKVTAQKTYFSTDQKNVSTLEMDCTADLSTHIELALTPDESAMLAENPNTTSPNGMHAPNTIDHNGVPRDYNPNLAPNSGIAGLRASDLAAGKVIELKNIFYDFDKYYIRQGAAIELDHVVALLQQYPSMIIELSSHTDARGSDKYNQWLSRKRAEKAVAYIRSKGIDSRRLVAKGYGESQLRNHCTNYVECTEKEHQYNRRTEIKILQFSESNVEVQYIDNPPEVIDAADTGLDYNWD